MSLNFTLKNTGGKDYNDIRYDEKFLLEGYSYTIIIRPNCKFWRLGLRFSFDKIGTAWSQTHRYNDAQIRHVEICVGTRQNDEWQNSDLIQLQQYHIPETPNTLFSAQEYKENLEVKLNIQPKGSGRIDVTLTFGAFSHTTLDLDLGFLGAFDIFGWADSIDFELNCEVHPLFTSLKIDLNTVKALSNQKSSIVIEKFAILFGKNNCGKTSVLLGTCNSFMNKLYYSMDYLGLNRIHTETIYNYELEGLDKYERDARQEENRKRRSENSIGQYQLFDWLEELALQDEQTREKILDWMKLHFERWDFEEIKRGRFTKGVEPKVNGNSPIEQGSGAKSVLPIIIQLFNPNVKLLTIDEPEFGLEPRMQRIVFQAIKDATEGANGFPLKRAILATHSHLFLDREKVSNNFLVTKINGTVTPHQLASIDELQDATFQLLGSNPTDLFFPENIIVVEGKSDSIFLKAIMSKMLEAGLLRKKHISFHFLEGIDKAKIGLEAIVQMLKTQSYFPIYKEKVCGLFDKPNKNSEKVIGSIRVFFGDAMMERFVTLPEPAIEYYYPLETINNAFRTSHDVATLRIEIEKFLSSVSKKPPFAGKFLEEEISKVEFASRIAAEYSKTGKSEEINKSILDLLLKADELSY